MPVLFADSIEPLAKTLAKSYGCLPKKWSKELALASLAINFITSPRFLDEDQVKDYVINATNPIDVAADILHKLGKAAKIEYIAEHVVDIPHCNGNVDEECCLETQAMENYGINGINRVLRVRFNMRPSPAIIAAKCTNPKSLTYDEAIWLEQATRCYLEVAYPDGILHLGKTQLDKVSFSNPVDLLHKLQMALPKTHGMLYNKESGHFEYEAILPRKITVASIAPIALPAPRAVIKAITSGGNNVTLLPTIVAVKKPKKSKMAKKAIAKKAKARTTKGKPLSTSKARERLRAINKRRRLLLARSR